MNKLKKEQQILLLNIERINSSNRERFGNNIHIMEALKECMVNIIEDNSHWINNVAGRVKYEVSDNVDKAVEDAPQKSVNKHI